MCRKAANRKGGGDIVLWYEFICGEHCFWSDYHQPALPFGGGVEALDLAGLQKQERVGVAVYFFKIDHVAAATLTEGYQQIELNDFKAGQKFRIRLFPYLGHGEDLNVELVCWIWGVAHGDNVFGGKWGISRHANDLSWEAMLKYGLV